MKFLLDGSIDRTPPKIYNPTDTELSYAAGIIDGEGCIFVDKNGRPDYKHCTILVNIGNTDGRIIAWFIKTFGGRVKTDFNLDTGTRHCYIWYMKGNKAFKLLNQISPLLIIKKEQAETAILFYKLKTREHSKERTTLMKELDVLIKSQKRKVHVYAEIK